LPIAHQDQSPFVVSDDRSPKMKERSPLAPTTKQYDDCTGSHRPIAHQERSPLAPTTKQYDDCTQSDRPSQQIPSGCYSIMSEHDRVKIAQKS